MKILLVEDEIRLAEGIARLLKMEKYDCDILCDGEEGLHYAMSKEYDVVILDVMLPGRDGFSIVKEMRKEKIGTPVLMLTARGETQDKIYGLDSGADDYLTKPFVPEELIARVRALSRRQGEVIMDELSFGDLRLELPTYTLRCGYRSVNLTAKEFEILRLLMKNPKIILSKEEIISKIWGLDSEAQDNNVEVYISFLRKKLFFVQSEVVIRSLRKIGYRLESQNAQQT